MDTEENKKETGGQIGGVIDALHNKAKLPSLRSYQGDMAEFIKEKNESVVSVAVKEKKREEERREESPKIVLKSKPSSLNLNFTIIFLSIFLLIGGGAVSLYIYQFINRAPEPEVVDQPEILETNNAVTLANVNKNTLTLELNKMSTTPGISLAKIANLSGQPIKNSTELFEFLEIPETFSIRRTLEDQFMLGTISQNNISASFLIIKVEDFGRAFASMLDWEATMLTDLKFLTTVVDSSGKFAWKDLIIKNKDARAFIDERGNAQIVYTFLDRNTILITNNILLVDDVGNLYNSQAVVR